MTVTDEIDHFIEANTNQLLGHDNNQRTRDALNIALYKLQAAEARASAAEQERDDARFRFAEAQARIAELEAEQTGEYNPLILHNDELLRAVKACMAGDVS